MKFHLPKSLLVAVLAAMVYPVQAATVLTPGEVVGTDGDVVFDADNSLPESFVTGSVSQVTNSKGNTYSYNNPFLKDGVDTSLTISGFGTMEAPTVVASPLYVREGNATVSDSFILTASGKGTSPQAVIHVGGNNANLTIENSTYGDKTAYEKTDGSASIVVGTADGAGSLTLDNSHVYAMSIWAGMNTEKEYYCSYNATTKESNPESARYDNGVYTEVEYDGTTKKLGTCDIHISNKSTVNLNSSVELGDGTMTVDDSTLTFGRWGVGNFCLGRLDGSSSVLNVVNGGKVESKYGHMRTTNYWIAYDNYDDSDAKKVVVNVNGPGSTIDLSGSIILLATQEGTSMNVTDGGLVKSGSISLGAENSKEMGDNVVLTLDGSSSIETGSFTAHDGVKICLTDADKQETASIKVTGSMTLSSGSVFEISLSEAFDSETLRVAIAGLDSAEAAEDWFSMDAASLTLNSLFWTASDFSVEVVDNVAYANATLTTTKEDGKVVVEDKDVVLESENALGKDPINTKGDTTLSAAEGVEVMLPDTIENEGNLTISGAFNGEKLEIVENEADTNVCVRNKDGKNGFRRSGKTVVTVVENKDGASLTVGKGTFVSKGDDKLHLSSSGKAGKLDYSNYHFEEKGHTAAMSQIQGMRPDEKAALTISMTNGTFVADADAKDVQATGGTIATKGDVTVGGKLSGTTSVVVGDGMATLTGDNDYTGDTVISGENAKLKVNNGKALGHSKVHLQKHGQLDLNGQAVGNAINVTGCELHNASAYTGDMEVSGDLKVCGSNATANKVTFSENGHISASANETLTLNTIEVATNGVHAAQLGIDTTVKESIVLNNGSILTVGDKATLTLASGTTITLIGGGYGKGDVLIEGGNIESPAYGAVTLDYGYGVYTMDGNNVVLDRVFHQAVANYFTLANWGQATASRAFVNAVRGQHNNTGCIANGKGTVWFSLLGASNDIDGSDIDLEGAALGVDMKVGEASVLGIASGYVEGELRPNGSIQKHDSESSYLALYGQHRLAKLSPKSCLSLGWVAAYGTTETKIGSMNVEQDSLQLNTRLSWNKKVTNRLCMNVFGGLEYYTNESDTVDGKKTGSLQNLRGEIGVGARYVAWGTPAVTDNKSGLTLSRGCEKLVLHGELRYMNDMVRNNPVVRMDGLSGTGTNPGRQGVGVEAGATFRISERWSASANYGFNTMEDSREHRVNVGASYTF